MTIDFNAVLDELINNGGYDSSSAMDAIEKIKEEIDVYGHSNLSDYMKEA
jgi:hypothetical protein